ncbi:MAG: holin family protein [Paracoccaceae bacterium]
MGVIGQILGADRAIAAAQGVAEVFTPSATRRMELSAEAQMAALRQLGAEYQLAPQGWFDRFVNGINRLPRPMLAFGTIGLFVYAMMDPENFARRMVWLNAVPEPLWWLLGAVVGFYFGAREAHYFRARPVTAGGASVAEATTTPTQDENPALRDWQSGQ